MLPYFPFGQQFNDKMGTHPLLENQCLIEVDEQYTNQLTLKRQLLTEIPDYYFQALPGYEPAQWEALGLVLETMARFTPDSFSLRQQGNHWRWQNNLLNEETTFTVGDSQTLPFAPLDWIGRQVQEDLILLSGDNSQLVAGQLCFGNDWSLDEKLGLPFWQIHAPIVPIVEPMLRAAQQFMERLPAGRPVWRLNWSVKISDQLDMTSRNKQDLEQFLHDRLPGLTPETIGNQLYIRIERQTLTRLPQSGAILFGIRTYQNLLAHEASDPKRANRMAQVFSTTPPRCLPTKI
ncbi:DUF3445 domain-containing protein [Spirosoma telluris]|uniref:heme-dependent oxidative N-demethylase family protein n=1 Tax=Spirosoma telluris TaxID=2183553 RepID=UPI002FC2D942